METKNGRSVLIHLNCKGKRTTASMNSDLADLLCLKLDNKLSKDAGKVLQEWAQGVQEVGDYAAFGISFVLARYAMLEIADPAIRQAWLDIDDG